MADTQGTHNYSLLFYVSQKSNTDGWGLKAHSHSQLVTIQAKHAETEIDMW